MMLLKEHQNREITGKVALPAKKELTQSGILKDEFSFKNYESIVKPLRTKTDIVCLQ